MSPTHEAPPAEAINKATRKRRPRNGNGEHGIAGEVNVASTDPSPISPAGSEDAMALELATRHGHELRYVAEIGKWFRWDGRYWAEDRTVAIYDLARPIVRAWAGRFKGSTRRKIASAATVSGIERLARSDRRLAMTADQFNADPALLNTPGGLVDLRTGITSPCDAAALCSQIAAVAPADNDDCPTWKAALALYMNNASEMIAFLQRLAGYCLWGALVDQILVFACGKGGNGKGTFFNTLMRVMGSYAKAAPSEVFLASNFDRHPTELARLRDTRLVVSSEIEKGRRWNMPRLNSLTGGDKVTAHFMRQDDFEYTPRFKLTIFGNNKPTFGKVDEAVRRRLRLVAFNHIVTDEDRAANPDFDDRITAEWPAILRWMIIGCLDWQREGLNPPKAVLDASTDYLASQNNFAAWLAEACVKSPNSKTSVADLFGSWKAWCDANGEKYGSARALGDLLEEAGFPRKRVAHGKRTHDGLYLVNQPSSEEPLL
jgi:putative DNA primase/helicase